MRADGTSPRRLTDHSNSNDSWPDLSPDGKKIVYVSYKNWYGDRRDSEIYVMDADGAHVTRLTENNFLDSHPVWSPDGGKIAFATNRDGNWEIYAMNADGSNPINLTNHPSDDKNPDW